MLYIIYVIFDICYTLYMLYLIYVISYRCYILYILYLQSIFMFTNLYHLSPNPSLAMSEGCFTFHFARLRFNRTWSIYSTVAYRRSRKATAAARDREMDTSSNDMAVLIPHPEITNELLCLIRRNKHLTK